MAKVIFHPSPGITLGPFERVQGEVNGTTPFDYPYNQAVDVPDEILAVLKDSRTILTIVDESVPPAEPKREDDDAPRRSSRYTR